MAIDLTSLDYPRHLHKEGASLIVQNADEAALAVKDGYALLPAGAEYDVPGARSLPHPKVAKKSEKA